MTLSAAQRKRIDFFLEDEWVDEDDDEIATAENLARLLGEVESAEELHVMVAEFNWDTEGETVLTILKHPLCDVATTLLAYWRSGPRYYSRFANEAEIDAEYMIEGWELVQKLHAAVEARLGERASIRFDPANDATSDGYDWTADYRDAMRATPVYEVPPAFERAV